MGMSLKQIRYLYAIGVFKGDPAKFKPKLKGWRAEARKLKPPAHKEKIFAGGTNVPSTSSPEQYTRTYSPRNLLRLKNIEDSVRRKNPGMSQEEQTIESRKQFGKAVQSKFDSKFGVKETESQIRDMYGDDVAFHKRWSEDHLSIASSWKQTDVASIISTVIPPDEVKKLNLSEPVELDMSEGTIRIQTPNRNHGRRPSLLIKATVSGTSARLEDLILPEDSTGKGIGKKMYDGILSSLAQRGVRKISLHANLDVGGYMWAKMGYEIDMPPKKKKGYSQSAYKAAEDRLRYSDTLDKIRSSLEDLETRRPELSSSIKKIKPPPWDSDSDDNHPVWSMQEFMKFEVPGESDFKKKVLLTTSWNGTLKLKKVKK